MCNKTHVNWPTASGERWKHRVHMLRQHGNICACAPGRMLHSGGGCTFFAAMITALCSVRDAEATEHTGARPGATNAAADAAKQTTSKLRSIPERQSEISEVQAGDKQT